MTMITLDDKMLFCVVFCKEGVYLWIGVFAAIVF